MTFKALILTSLTGLISNNLLAQTVCTPTPSTQVKEIVQTVNAVNPSIAMMKSAEDNMNASPFASVETRTNHRHILGRKLNQLEATLNQEKSTVVKAYYLNWFSQHREKIAKPNIEAPEDLALRASVDTHFNLLKDPELSDEMKTSALQNMVDILGYNAANPSIEMMKSAEEQMGSYFFADVETLTNDRHILGRKLKQLEGSLSQEKSPAVKAYYLNWFSQHREKIAEPYIRTTGEVAFGASVDTHFKMLKDPELNDELKNSALQNMVDVLGYKVLRSESGIHYVGANVGVQAGVIEGLDNLIKDKTLSQGSLQKLYLALRQNLEGLRWKTLMEDDREKTEWLLLKAKALLPKIEAATARGE